MNLEFVCVVPCPPRHSLVVGRVVDDEMDFRSPRLVVAEKTVDETLEAI